MMRMLPLPVSSAFELLDRELTTTYESLSLRQYFRRILVNLPSYDSISPAADSSKGTSLS